MFLAFSCVACTAEDFSVERTCRRYFLLPLESCRFMKQCSPLRKYSVDQRVLLLAFEMCLCISGADISLPHYT